MIKKYLFSFVLLFLISQVWCEKLHLTISKVKVFLDDVELTEDNEGEIKKSTILSYTNFKEGKSLSESAINHEVTELKLRLMDSGLFYTAEVEAVKSRKNPDAVIIVISVRKGFLMRFGGGAIYGLFGRVSLGGNRNKLLGYAGYNKSGVSYIDENICGIPLVLGAAAFTNLPEAFAGKENYKLESDVKTGFYITPDLCIGEDTGFFYDFGNKDELNYSFDLLLSPYVFLKHYYSERLFNTAEVRSFNNPLKNTHAFEAAYTINFALTKRINLAGLVSGGFVKDTKINLEKDSLPFYEQPGLSNRGIRSGYSKEDLLTDTYCLCTFETRFRAANVSIPPCFPCEIVPYLFADVAFAHDYDSDDADLLDAFGAGVQLNLDSPVFVYFNFSYGVNHFGKGKFTFAAMQSF